MCTPPEMTCGFLIQLVFCKKKKMWFIGVEVEQETSAPPPKKIPGSAPVGAFLTILVICGHNSRNNTYFKSKQSSPIEYKLRL